MKNSSRNLYPRGIFSPGWTPTLSVWHNSRGAPWLLTYSEPAPTGSHPSYIGGHRTGQSTPGGVSPEQGRRAESPPSACWPHCFWYSPAHSWFFWATSAHCRAMYDYWECSTKNVSSLSKPWSSILDHVQTHHPDCSPFVWKTMALIISGCPILAWERTP